MQELSRWLQLLNVPEVLKSMIFENCVFHNYFDFYLLSSTFLHPPPTLSPPPRKVVKAEKGC